MADRLGPQVLLYYGTSVTDAGSISTGAWRRLSGFARRVGPATFRGSGSRSVHVRVVNLEGHGRHFFRARALVGCQNGAGDEQVEDVSQRPSPSIRLGARPGQQRPAQAKSYGLPAALHRRPSRLTGRPHVGGLHVFNGRRGWVGLGHSCGTRLVGRHGCGEPFHAMEPRLCSFAGKARARRCRAKPLHESRYGLAPCWRCR